MNIPEFLREENMKDTIDPEVKKAIQRYKDHFGKFEIEQVFFYSRETTIKIIDYCINVNKCYRELFPRDPNAIY